MLYGALFGLGLFTALLTAFYTFRMLFVVFHGEISPPFKKGGQGGISPGDDHQIPLNPPFLKGENMPGLPSIMTITLIPLAIIGLCGGLLEPPEYLHYQAFLSGFLDSIPGFNGLSQVSSGDEIALQIIAATTSVIGLGLAWSRYTGARRAVSLTIEEPVRRAPISFSIGWYLDNLYRLLLIRPFVWLSRFLWKRIDESGIDGTLDGLARLTARPENFPPDGAAAGSPPLCSVWPAGCALCLSILPGLY